MQTSMSKYVCRVTNKAGHEFMVYRESDELVTFCLVHPGTTVHIGYTIPMYVCDLIGPVKDAIAGALSIDLRQYKKPVKQTKRAARVAEVLSDDNSDNLAKELGLL